MGEAWVGVWGWEALEVVVKDVTAERGGRHGGGKEGSAGAGEDKKMAKSGEAKTENDSSLKEGIRRWLSEVE